MVNKKYHYYFILTLEKYQEKNFFLYYFFILDDGQKRLEDLIFHLFDEVELFTHGYMHFIHMKELFPRNGFGWVGSLKYNFLMANNFKKGFLAMFCHNFSDYQVLLMLAFLIFFVIKVDIFFTFFSIKNCQYCSMMIRFNYTFSFWTFMFA